MADFSCETVAGAPDLAEVTINGRFQSCAVAWLLLRPARSVSCMSEGRDFDPVALGSDRTDASQHGRRFEPPAERPQWKQAPISFAFATKVRSPPFVTIVARCSGRGVVEPDAEGGVIGAANTLQKKSVPVSPGDHPERARPTPLDRRNPSESGIFSAAHTAHAARKTRHICDERAGRAWPASGVAAPACGHQNIDLYGVFWREGMGLQSNLLRPLT